jgi:hypothetical protein
MSSNARAAAAAAISRAGRGGQTGTSLLQRCREGRILRCAEDVPGREIPRRQQRQRVLPCQGRYFCTDFQRRGHQGGQIVADGRHWQRSCFTSTCRRRISKEACGASGCVSQGKARGGAGGGAIVAKQAPPLAGAGAEARPHHISIRSAMVVVTLCIIRMRRQRSAAALLSAAPSLVAASAVQQQASRALQLPRPTDTAAGTAGR